MIIMISMTKNHRISSKNNKAHFNNKERNKAYQIYLQVVPKKKVRILHIRFKSIFNLVMAKILILLIYFQ